MDFGLTFVDIFSSVHPAMLGQHVWNHLADLIWHPSGAPRGGLLPVHRLLRRVGLWQRVDDPQIYFLCVNFWSNLTPYGSVWFKIRGRTEPEIGKNWNGQSTVALSFYFWQFCSGELVVELLMPRSKNFEKCYRWDFFILDPKKSKKARKCDKILLYYWVHSYEFEFKRTTNVKE